MTHGLWVTIKHSLYTFIILKLFFVCLEVIPLGSYILICMYLLKILNSYMNSILFPSGQVQ